jgi:hypothetical protein
MTFISFYGGRFGPRDEQKNAAKARGALAAAHFGVAGTR